MQLTIDSSLLKSALNKILSVVDKKNSRPILSYCLMTAKKGFLELSGTDLEVSAKVIVEANVENEGSYCINIKTFFEIIREIPETIIQLHSNENQTSLSLSCKDIHYGLMIYKTDDFPHLNFEQKDSEFTLQSKQVLDLISKTAHSISQEETRLYLNGLFLQEIKNKIRGVSTDGHRLSLFETNLKRTNNQSLINGIIVPKKGVFELKKMAECYPDKELNISVNDSFMYISAENTYFLSIRLIAREYPKYQGVIPNKTIFMATADRDALLDAIKRVRIMSNEKSHRIKVLLQPNEITIIANHPSLGHAQEKLHIEYEGQKMEIGFNARYLIDSLSVFDSGDICIELNNELSPILIKSPQLPDYVGLIMPLKL